MINYGWCKHPEKQDVISFEIENYNKESLILYRCMVFPEIGGNDTLMLVDSFYTDNNGKVEIVINQVISDGLYKIVLKKNQWFYVLVDGNPITIKTEFIPDLFNNIATDSLKVIESEENKHFYLFQHIQKQLSVANYFLIQMMRWYPLEDKFHQKIEEEYLQRHQNALQVFNEIINLNSPSGLIAQAYYQPINPDWKQPDQWRDSVIAAHFFDFFNPSNEFYLKTNILSEKMENYITLKSNKKDEYGQPIVDEMIFAIAGIEFLERTITKINFSNTNGNHTNFLYCLNYLLKKFDKERKEYAFLHLYNTYTQYINPQNSACNSAYNFFDWAREKANKLKGLQIGSKSSDFELAKNLNLSSINSKYTLIVFWATWCPHCVEEMPKIKEIVEEYNQQKKTLNIVNDDSEKFNTIVIAVSLDKDENELQQYIEKHHLNNFLNFCEFKGWESSLVKLYNVYATPTMVLLDENKKIIAKPQTVAQLKEMLK